MKVISIYVLVQMAVFALYYIKYFFTSAQALQNYGRLPLLIELIDNINRMKIP